MLKTVPMPPPEQLTARARRYAFPELTAAAREALAAAAPRAAGLEISPDALIAEARARTGLTEFGDAPLMAPLAALCASLNDELEFHALGRVYLYEQLVGLL